MLSSGPNTYRDPVKESSVEGLVGKCVLTIYHTLPIDVVALVNLVSDRVLKSAGRVLYGQRVLYPCDLDDGPPASDDDAFDFSCMLKSILLCFEHWGDTMLTRAELGRFGKKLEGKMAAVRHCLSCRPAP